MLLFKLVLIQSGFDHDIFRPCSQKKFPRNFKLIKPWKQFYWQKKLVQNMKHTPSKPLLFNLSGIWIPLLRVIQLRFVVLAGKYKYLWMELITNFSPNWVSGNQCFQNHPNWEGSELTRRFRIEPARMKLILAFIAAIRGSLKRFFIEILFYENIKCNKT